MSRPACPCGTKFPERLGLTVHLTRAHGLNLQEAQGTASALIEGAELPEAARRVFKDQPCHSSGTPDRPTFPTDADLDRALKGQADGPRVATPGVPRQRDRHANRDGDPPDDPRGERDRRDGDLRGDQAGRRASKPKLKVPGWISAAARKIAIPLPEYLERRARGEKFCSGHRAWHLREAFVTDRARGDSLSHYCREWRNGRACGFCRLSKAGRCWRHGGQGAKSERDRAKLEHRLKRWVLRREQADAQVRRLTALLEEKR